MFQSNWQFILDTKSEKNAHIVMRRVLTALKIQPTIYELSPYQKAEFQGYQVSTTFTHAINDWNLCVLTVIDLGQRLGTDWRIGGDVFENLDAVLAKNMGHISIVGLHWVHWEIRRYE